MIVTVRRKQLRPLLAVLFAICALVAAVDLLGAYRIFDPPDETAEGVLTADGRGERRHDLAWGAALALSGLGLGAWALAEIWRSRSVLEADENGVAIGIAPKGGRWRVPWSDVAGIRSTVWTDDAGSIEVLDVELTSPAVVPGGWRRARVVGSHVLVDADDWAQPAHYVAGRLQLLRERYEQLGRPAPPGPA